MPISDVFDPYTGGAIGGGVPSGGGGASLYKAPYEVINLSDPSWTLFDPLNLVKSVTFDGTHNTITWNATVYRADLRWFISGTKNAPRWYKLQQVEGNQITSMDYQCFSSIIDLDLTVDDFNQAVGLTVTEGPTETNDSLIRVSGGYATKLVGGNPAWGTLQYTGVTTGYNASANYGFCNSTRGGNSLGSGAYLIPSSTDDRVYNAGSRNSNIQSTDAVGDNTYITVIIGIRGTNDTVAQDDQQRVRLAYNTFVPNVEDVL